MSEPSAASPVCAIVRGSFADYLQESLAAPQRRMLRDHLLACEGCRGAAEAADPSLRFARRLPDTVSEDEGREILAAVRTGVDLLQAERRLVSGRKRARRFRAPSAAAAAVAAVILLSSGWGILRGRRAPETGTAAAIPARLSPVPQPAPGPATLQPAGLSEPASNPADATVYDWNPGAGREEPRVVWIVDRGLDI